MGKCYIGNKEVTCAEWDAARKSRYADSAKVQSGQSVGQEGSQFWLNTDYAGAEPSTEVKAAYSTADYARSWISAKAQTITQQASAAGTKVSKAVENIANYPESEYQASYEKVWTDYPTISPTRTEVGAAKIKSASDAANVSRVSNGTTVASSWEPTTSGSGVSSSADSSSIGSMGLLLVVLAGAALLMSVRSPRRI